MANVRNEVLSYSLSRSIWFVPLASTHRDRCEELREQQSLIAVPIYRLILAAAISLGPITLSVSEPAAEEAAQVDLDINKCRYIPPYVVCDQQVPGGGTIKLRISKEQLQSLMNAAK